MARAHKAPVDESRGVFIDTTKPSLARSYDAMIGGKDNYEVDRRFVEELLAIAPAMRPLGWDNRGFLIRATRFLAGEAGIDQFLDLGSGLPTAENTHQAAQRINPEACVTYVDSDPMVQAHGRALLAENGRTHFLAADFTEPDALLSDLVLRGYVDLSRPLALYQVGTLHHVADADHPERLMAAYIDALPAGSYVVISHFFNPGAEDPELAELAVRLEQSFLSGPLGTGRFRETAQIAGLFNDLELVEPGLVTVGDWWPDGPKLRPVDPVRRLMVGGVGRKP